MSLLMEALRKAEEAKRRIQSPDDDRADASGLITDQQKIIRPSHTLPRFEGELTLEEREDEVSSDDLVDDFLPGSNKTSFADAKQFITSAPVISSATPNRASVEELQKYLATTPELEETPAAPQSQAPPKLSQATSQQTAGAVFAAKQKPASTHTTRNSLLALTVLIVLLGGGAFWYIANQGNSSLMIDPALLDADFSNRSFSDESMAASPAARPEQQISERAITSSNEDQSQTATTDATTSSVAMTGDQQAQAPLNGLTPETTARDATATPPQIESPTNSAAPVQPSVAQPARTAGATANNELLLDTIESEPSSVLEVSHSTGTKNHNQQLVDAYATFQAGDAKAAASLYQQVLEQFPNNRDALLGRAAIALRDADIVQARAFYSRLMQLNPRDPLARTGLLQTVQDLDPAEYEQELQRLRQQFPEVAPLAFALGNVYASQSRWDEAQTAYFDALLFARRGNETAISPDYAFNLAISLEQINQPAAALDYYRQAQTLARDVTPGFDMQTLSRRISLLEQTSP